MDSSILMILLMFAVFYFMLMRPEKKRKQQAEDMRSGLKKNDKISTIGGIVGNIVAVNNTTIIVETSEDRVRMELAKWAVASNHTRDAAMAAEAQAKKDKKAKGKKNEEAPAAESATAEDLTKNIEG